MYTFIVSVMLFCFFLTYLLGKSLEQNRRFYDEKGKGTIPGKAIFSIFLLMIMLFPGYILSAAEWAMIVTLVSSAIIIAELAIGIAKSRSKSVVGMIFGLAIILCLAKLLHEPPGAMFLLQVIGICVIVDLVSNLTGKRLARNERFKGILLKYPAWISPNKSMTAALLGVFVALLLNGFIPDKWSVTFITCALAGGGAILGDIMFSIFKRSMGLKDFPATLGPIGGISDRADSWVFALLLATI